MSDENTAPLQPRMALATSSRSLQKLAVQGGFKVDENTGNAMIKALQGMIDSLEARWDALQKVGHVPQLGQSSTAQWVSGHMVATASDEAGLLTQLRSAREEFPRYIDAIRQAKRNYHETEQNTVRRIAETDSDH